MIPKLPDMIPLACHRQSRSAGFSALRLLHVFRCVFGRSCPVVCVCVSMGGRGKSHSPKQAQKGLRILGFEDTGIELTRIHEDQTII